MSNHGQYNNFYFAAVSIESGKILWDFTDSSGGAQFYTMGTTGAGLVFATYGYSPGSSAFALNETNGKQVWAVGGFLAGDYLGLNFADNKLFSSGYQTLSILNPDTGVAIGAAVFPNAGAQEIPAISDGMVYAYNYSGTVGAFNEQTGAPVWTNALFSSQGGYPLTGSVVAYDGLVFVSSASSQVYALNQTNGALVWRGEASSIEAAADGQVVVSEQSGSCLVSLDALTGKIRWVDDLNVTSFGVGGGVAVASTSQGQIFGIDMSSGRALWSTPHSQRIYAAGNLILPGGIIVVPTTTNSLLVLEPSSSSPSTSSSPAILALSFQPGLFGVLSITTAFLAIPLLTSLAKKTHSH